MIVVPIKIRWSIILPILILLSPFFFFAIGMPYQEIASDASTYDLYARNIATGHGFTMDPSVAFSAFREPGYPSFVALVYKLFGVGNYTAVYILQSLLLGLLGLLVLSLFKNGGAPRLGYAAAFLLCLLPTYGIYTHTMGTELISAVVLGLIFYLVVILVRKGNDVSYWFYAFLGFVLGYATLMRAQLLLLLPLLVVTYIFLYRRRVAQVWKKSALTCVVFLLIVGSWMTYVHSHTGHFSLTEGRQGLSWYMRADRAELSYVDLTKYAAHWIKRSLTGGKSTEFLERHEYQFLEIGYWNMATTSQAAAKIQAQSLGIIRANAGHFIYGNIIEAMKTLYIEHDYSNVLNKYWRSGTYILLYGLCLVGLILLWRNRKAPGQSYWQLLTILGLIIIGYNTFIVSFFDSIPRYNTPYLTFYLVIGFAGIASYLNSKTSIEPEE